MSRLLSYVITVADDQRILVRFEDDYLYFLNLDSPVEGVAEEDLDLLTLSAPPCWLVRHRPYTPPQVCSTPPPYGPLGHVDPYHVGLERRLREHHPHGDALAQALTADLDRGPLSAQQLGGPGHSGRACCADFGSLSCLADLRSEAARPFAILRPFGDPELFCCNIGGAILVLVGDLEIDFAGVFVPGRVGSYRKESCFVRLGRARGDLDFLVRGLTGRYTFPETITRIVAACPQAWTFSALLACGAAYGLRRAPLLDPCLFSIRETVPVVFGGIPREALEVGLLNFLRLEGNDRYPSDFVIGPDPRLAAVGLHNFPCLRALAVAQGAIAATAADPDPLCDLDFPFCSVAEARCYGRYPPDPDITGLSPEELDNFLSGYGISGPARAPTPPPRSPRSPRPPGPPGGAPGGGIGGGAGNGGGDPSGGAPGDEGADQSGKGGEPAGDGAGTTFSSDAPPAGGSEAGPDAGASEAALDAAPEATAEGLEGPVEDTEPGEAGRPGGPGEEAESTDRAVTSAEPSGLFGLAGLSEHSGRSELSEPATPAELLPPAGDRSAAESDSAPGFLPDQTPNPTANAPAERSGRSEYSSFLLAIASDVGSAGEAIPRTPARRVARPMGSNIFQGDLPSEGEEGSTSEGLSENTDEGAYGGCGDAGVPVYSFPIRGPPVYDFGPAPAFGVPNFQPSGASKSPASSGLSESSHLSDLPSDDLGSLGPSFQRSLRSISRSRASFLAAGTRRTGYKPRMYFSVPFLRPYSRLCLLYRRH